MFWRFNFQGSTLDQLLNKPETSLEDILNQPEIIQELKTQNAKLITFVAQPDKIQSMLAYVSSFNETFAPICSEIFGLELPQIAAVIFTAPHLIESFIQVLLNKEWTSYEGFSFIKVVSSILYRDPKTSITLLKSLKINHVSFLSAICAKINNGHSILYELLLKLSALDEVLQDDFIVDWFKQESVVQFLQSQLQFTNLSDSNGLDKIQSATSCLLDFFAVSQAISVIQVPLCDNHVIQDLVSGPFIIESLDFVNEYYLKPSSLDSSLVSQSYITLLSLVNDLIRRNYLDFVLGLHQQALTIRMEEFTEVQVINNILNDPHKYLLDVMNIGHVVCRYMDLFYNILINPISKIKKQTTVHEDALNINSALYVKSSIGTLQVFGIERFKTVELLVELLRMVVDQDGLLIHDKLKLKTNHPDSVELICKTIIQHFIDSKILILLMNLFFEYPWCNILHSLILDVITFIFDEPTQFVLPLAKHILKESSLISMIVNANALNTKNILTPRQNRLPYMGHLTLISEIIVHHLQINTNTYDDVLILKQDDWVEYKCKILPATIIKDRQILGGVKPPIHMMNQGGEAAVMGNQQSSIISSDSGYMLDPFHHKTSDDILHKSTGKLHDKEEESEESEPIKPTTEHTTNATTTDNEEWKYTSIEDPFEQSMPGQWIGEEAAKKFIQQIGEMMPIQFVGPSLAAIDGSGLTFAKEVGKTEEPAIVVDDPFDIQVSPVREPGPLKSHKEEMMGIVEQQKKLKEQLERKERIKREEEEALKKKLVEEAAKKHKEEEEEMARKAVAQKQKDLQGNKENEVKKENLKADTITVADKIDTAKMEGIVKPKEETDKGATLKKTKEDNVEEQIDNEEIDRNATLKKGSINEESKKDDVVDK